MTSLYMLVVIVIVISTISDLAYAQSSDISLSMQKDIYYPNDVVAINGTTSSNQLVTVEIKNPFDKTVYEKSLLPTEKGQFSISYIVDSYPTKGTYVVLVTQNSETTSSYFGVYYKPSIRLEASLDKINYQNTDQPHITILDLPESVIDVKIFDNSQVQQFEDKIKTSSDGHATCILNITSYPIGVYGVQVTSDTGQQKMGFSVGLEHTSGPIMINTEKDTYLPGEDILILGTGYSNTLAKLSLIDPAGTSVKSIQIFSDNTGHFTSSDLQIPSNALSGIWHIDATSGVNHETTEIRVNSSQLPSYVQNSTNTTIPIHVSEPVVITITSISSPLQQFKSGVVANNIICRSDLQLLIENHEGFPICVRQNSVPKLLNQDWSYPSNCKYDQGPFTAGVSGIIVIEKNASNQFSGKSYSPRNSTVVIGWNNTVSWLNLDDTPSSVTSNWNIFDSGSILPGKDWQHSFECVGNYGYHSEPHPWMKGWIRVLPPNIG